MTTAPTSDWTCHLARSSGTVDAYSSKRRRRIEGFMETHEIRYFLATVRELNFTRAAAACNVSQPALTRAIKKLEGELGGALFVRRPGRIELTRLARTVIPRLEIIEQNMDRVRAEAQALADERLVMLRLGVMCTLSPRHVVDILRMLRTSIPDIEISIVEGKASGILELLENDMIDVGITAWPHYPDTLAVHDLYEERYVVAMAEQHPLANHEQVRLEDLSGQPYLERLNCEFDDFYEALQGPWTVDIDVCFSSELEDWIQGMIAARIGCAILPEFMMLAPGIVSRPLIPEVRRRVCLAFLRGRPLSEPAQQFIRIAKARRWNTVE